MTAYKDRCHLALPDIDPSIALAQAARQDFAHKFLADRHAVDQLIPSGKRYRAGFTAALQGCFAALLKSTFRTSSGVTASVRSDASMSG